MIGRLTGRVIADDEDGAIVIDVGGVGYEVITPIGTRGRAKVEDGVTTLFIHTHVREDIFSLFGFATEVDRTAFRTLIGVSSVGPKTAVAVLSALPGPELGRVIARKELAKLTSISGIGKKTAERLLLELEGKLTTTDVGKPGEPIVVTPGKRGDGDKTELLHGALTRMGYRREEADRAVKALEAEIEARTLAELVREALVVLSR
jgi:Holliday junction DNA helicase RuvA